MKIIKRIAALALVVFTLMSFTACEPKPVVEKDTELGQAINLTGEYLAKKEKEPKHGDEVVLIGLLRSGYIDFWDARATKYQTYANNYIKQNGGTIGTKKEIYADQYPLVIYAFTACGIYADRTSNRDLTRGISYDSIVLKGGYVNKINALTAIECCGDGEQRYHMFEDGDLTVEDLVKFTLSLQKEDGSFDYKGREDSLLKVTSSAVVALKLAQLNGDAPGADVTAAIAKGAEFIKQNAKATDTIDDLVCSIIGLNTAEIDAEELVKGLLLHQYSDGSFAENKTDKKGNFDDAALAMWGLASQHRFVNGKTSFYDMRDVLGGTHNQLSPVWKSYVNFMKYALGAVVFAVLVLYVVSRIRIKRWIADGTYNEQTGQRIVSAFATPEEVQEAIKKTSRDYFRSERVDEPEKTTEETSINEVAPSADEVASDAAEVSGEGADADE